jgi:TetR/AcrR family fatty acid metabolism transcriptional regulator
MAMGASVFTAIDSIVHNRPFDPNNTSDTIYQLVINATGTETNISEKHNKIHKGERAEIRRNQIVQKAVRIFANKGYSNATISEVAKHAGLGDATLYEYFKNKEAILLDAGEIFLRNIVSDEDPHLKGFSHPEKRLRKLLWHYIWQLYLFEDFTCVLTLELFRNIRFYSSPGYKCLEAFFERVLEAVREGQLEGLFIEEVPVPTYLHMIVGTFDQFLLSQFLLNKAPLGLAELNTIVDSLVRAIRVRETS